MRKLYVMVHQLPLLVRDNFCHNVHEGSGLQPYTCVGGWAAVMSLRVRELISPILTKLLAQTSGLNTKQGRINNLQRDVTVHTGMYFILFEQEAGMEEL